MDQLNSEFYSQVNKSKLRSEEMITRNKALFPSSKVEKNQNFLNLKNPQYSNKPDFVPNYKFAGNKDVPTAVQEMKDEVNHNNNNEVSKKSKKYLPGIK